MQPSGDAAMSPDAAQSNSGARIVFPPANALTDADEITLRGTASDPEGVAQVRVNGTTATSSDGYATWTFSAALGAGANTFSVEVEDGAGNVATRVAEVTVRREENLLTLPEGIALDAEGTTAFVTDFRGFNDVIAVDLATGLRTVVASADTGAGPSLGLSDCIALDSARDRLLVGDAFGDVFAIELVSGDRSLLGEQLAGSDCNAIAMVPGTSRLLKFAG